MPAQRMILLTLCWLLLFSIGGVNGAETPTNCNTQLHNYFVAKGMPMVTPVLLAINLTQGSLLGMNYVDIGINIQDVVRTYANLLPNTTLANQSWVVDFSVDCPWCLSQIGYSCIDNISTGTAKTSNCTTLIDFDLGGTDPVAGRFYVYMNQSLACGGDGTMRFYNVSLNPSDTGTWTYEVVGLRDHVQMNFFQARNSYRSSYCKFSDGAPIDIIDQNIFVCTMPQIACNATRVAGVPSLDVIPLPVFRCIGQLQPNGTRTIMMDVLNMQPPTGVEGEFLIGFVNDLAFAGGLQTQLLVGNDFKVSLPNTRRQFDQGSASFTRYTLIYTNGRWTNYQPIYPFSLDPQLSQVPCVCDFSMDCTVPGYADLVSYATFQLSLSNSVPICSPGPATSIPLNSPSFTLNATTSYDPDNGPGGLFVQWGIYGTPYDPNPPPFTIPNPGAFVNVINATGLISGDYFFILWVSDQQDIPVCIWNLTIRQNEVVAIITPSEFIETFDFYSGNMIGHECSIYPPSPAIMLNGTMSYSTDLLTNLTYYWIQTSGPPLEYSCDNIGFFTTRAFFNTNESIAYFVPSGVGYYCFQLIVSDGVVNSTAALACVTVNPDFGQPPSTFTPITNYTYPPLRNLTPPTRPNITFPPSTNAPFNTFPPVAQTPTTIIPNIPVIPPQPNITNLEVMAIYSTLAGWLIVIAFMTVIWNSYGNARFTGHMQKRVWARDTST